MEKRKNNMAWREITTSDVQTLLSEDELEKL